MTGAFGNSPQSVLLLLPQVEVSLDDGPDVPRLLVRQLGQVQLLARHRHRHAGQFGGAESRQAAGGGGRHRLVRCVGEGSNQAFSWNNVAKGGNKRRILQNNITAERKGAK